MNKEIDDLKNKTTVEKLNFYGFFIDDKNIKNSEVRTTNKYNMVCKNGHKIFARISNILMRSQNGRASGGCSECHKEELSKQSLNVTTGHLNPGYQIESKRVEAVNRVNSKTRTVYTVKCDNNHTFEVESGQFKNKVCPLCTEKVFLGQERTRKIFEHLFYEKFKRVRPDFLLNPKTNKNLELDGYSENLNIAFEFHGNQHFSNDTEFGGDYEEQSKRDKLKVELCAKNRTKLIEIIQPTSYIFDKFKQSVLEQIYEYFGGYNSLIQQYKINLNEINNEDLEITSKPIYDKEFRDFVANESPALDYKIKDDIVSNHADPIVMICPKNHEFTTTPIEFKNNSTGKKGRSIPCKQCYELEYGKVEKYTVEKCKEIGKLHNLELVSTEYKAINELLLWKDVNGQEQELTLRQLIRRKVKPII